MASLGAPTRKTLEFVEFASGTDGILMRLTGLPIPHGLVTSTTRKVRYIFFVHLSEVQPHEKKFCRSRREVFLLIYKRV